MIPKIIHYCWFGGKPLTPLAKKSIKSWKRTCPDYTIVRWDETNFDINGCKYTTEAYHEKKWAFVSDYARLKIIYENGGIYLDTDVELINNLDRVLNDEYFLAIEKGTNLYKDSKMVSIATGLGFGACAGNETIYMLLKEYGNDGFIVNGTIDTTPCPIRNTNAMKKFGFTGEDIIYKVNGGTVYPSEYFCPKDSVSLEVNLTPNTLSIHHFDGSWMPAKERIKMKIRQLLGKKTADKIRKLFCWIRR
ncbi:MAG: glycosyltransferase [Christensenellaceae bacterium]